MLPTTDDQVSLDNNLVRISLETDHTEVVQYLERVPRENWTSAIHSLLETGASVLNRVSASGDMDYIEKRFNDTAHSMEQFFGKFQTQLQGYLKDNFDPSSSTKGFMHNAIGLVLEEHESYVKQIEAMLGRAQDGQLTLDKNLDPNNKAGYVSALIQQIEGFDRRLLNQFNLSDSASFVGKLQGMVDNHFGDNGEVLKKIQGHMSLSEGTPLSQMQEALHKEIAELRDQLMQLKGQKELIEKTTIKGYPFETTVFEKLQEIARPHSDLVEDTSLKVVAISGSKKGDYLYTLANSEINIVVDAKNYAKLKSLRGMLSYLRDALEQRNAEMGIIVVPTKASMQKQIGDWNFYEGNKIITSLEHLEVSIKFAKFMMQLKYDADSDVNVVEIRAKLESIQQRMRDITVLKSKLTKLSNGVGSSVTEIQQMLDRLKEDIGSKLEDIEAALA
jgi:hypothetical protein